MKAVILARVSTEEQKEAGSSLPAQIARLEVYCQRNKFEIIQTYSFDESAYGTKRDEFDKILDLIAKTKERLAICFDKVDRLSRNVFDKRVSILYEKALAGQIELHFASDGQVLNDSISATQKFQFQINLGLAKYYSDAISDSVKRVNELKRRNGEITGRVPIGYTSKKEGSSPREVTPDPLRSPHITRAFELYGTGAYSLLTLHALITKEGLTGFYGKPMAPSVFARMLCNPFYYGLAQSKGKEYRHIYKPLITEELFRRCQEIMKGRAKAPTKYLAKPFAFRNMLTCGDCGCRYTPELHKGRFVYYSCTNSRKKCKKVYVNENDLLKPVLTDLRTMGSLDQKYADQITEDVRKFTEEKTRYHTQAISGLRLQYDDGQKKDDRLLELLIDGSITKEIYDKKHKEIKEKQYDLGIQLEEYTKADDNYHMAVATVLRLAKRAAIIVESSEPQEKNLFLNYLLQNSTVKGKTLSYSLRSPFNAILELALNPTGGAYWESNPG